MSSNAFNFDWQSLFGSGQKPSACWRRSFHLVSIVEESAGVDLAVAVCVYVPAGVGEALSSLLAGLLLDRGVAVQFVV